MSTLSQTHREREKDINRFFRMRGKTICPSARMAVGIKKYILVFYSYHCSNWNINFSFGTIQWIHKSGKLCWVDQVWILQRNLHFLSIWKKILYLEKRLNIARKKQRYEIFSTRTYLTWYYYSILSEVFVITWKLSLTFQLTVDILNYRRPYMKS